MIPIQPNWAATHSECPECGLPYDDTVEKRKHMKRHERIEFVEHALGRVLRNHEEREGLKSLGHSIIAGATTMMERVEGANLVIEGHYDRDLPRGPVKGPVPSLKEYALTVDNLDGFGDDVAKALRQYWTAQP